MMVTPLTPFKYRDIIGLTRDALVTAFTTGNLFVVLTVLTENCKHLFEKYNLKEEKTDTYVDVIVPISFNFPNIGKLLMLLFILFAAWFSGSTFSLMQYPTFIFAGLFDVIMSGVVITTQRLENMVFTDPYMEATLCFIVPDHRRAEFATREAVHRIPELKIGIPHASDYFFPKLKAYLPRARVTDDLRSC